MHSSRLSKNVVILHNGDYSGEVIIRKLRNDGNRDENVGEIVLQFEDLLEFVCSYVRSEKISKLEQATPEEILGL